MDTATWEVKPQDLFRSISSPFRDRAESDTALDRILPELTLESSSGQSRCLLSPDPCPSDWSGTFHSETQTQMLRAAGAASLRKTGCVYGVLTLLNLL